MYKMHIIRCLFIYEYLLLLYSTWRHSEDGDAESSRETSSAGGSDCEAEKRIKGGVDGAWSQHNLVNLNSQRLHKLTLRDKPPMSSSSDETEICNSLGVLVFEYLEREPPYHRKPLYDKASPCL